jgi:hypothetical protein
MTLTTLRAIDTGVDVDAIVIGTGGAGGESYCMTKTIDGKKARVVRGKVAASNGTVVEGADCTAGLPAGF